MKFDFTKLKTESLTDLMPRNDRHIQMDGEHPMTSADELMDETAGISQEELMRYAEEGDHTYTLTTDGQVASIGGDNWFDQCGYQAQVSSGAPWMATAEQLAQAFAAAHDSLDQAYAFAMNVFTRQAEYGGYADAQAVLGYGLTESMNPVVHNRPMVLKIKCG